jgi:hypothetical protein
MEPEMSIARMRSVDFTVTCTSPSRSWEVTVAGRDCSGAADGVGRALLPKIAVDGPTYECGSVRKSSWARGTLGSPVTEADWPGDEVAGEHPARRATSATHKAAVEVARENMVTSS